MDKGEHFEVKDKSLAEKGWMNVEWAERQMGALLRVKERFENEHEEDYHYLCGHCVISWTCTRQRVWR